MARFKAILAVSASLALMISTTGPAKAQDGGMWQVYIAGVPLRCASYYGEPVRIYMTRGLNNVGIATRVQRGQPIIVMNPDVLARFTPLVQVWWFAHECGHHALGPYNSETNADCWGVRVLRDQGFIRSVHDLQAFAYDLSSLPGSAVGHLPGPQRAQNVINCSLT
jgi:hypothetical protein